MTETTRRFRIPTCLVLPWVLAAATAVGQEQPGGAAYSERIDVELVTVDVWVTDAQGNPVPGLGADGFQVRHDDRPATITHFTEVRGGKAVETTATEGAAGTARGFLPIPAPPGHTIVYFDQSRIQPSRYPALIRSLERFLRAEETASERVLILRQDRGLSVEAAFGSSHKELAQALERVARGAPGGMLLENETRLALDAIRDSWEQSQDAVGSAMAGLAAVPSATDPAGGAGNPSSGGGGPRSVVSGSGPGSGPDACGMFVNQIQPTLDSWAQAYGQGVAVTLTNLSSTAGFLAGLPGVKTLLYLGDGLQLRPAADLATYASSLCPAAGLDLLSGRLADQLRSGFLELARHASTNRVTIYSLQTSGLETPATGSASTGRSPRGGGGPRARAAFEASRRAADRDGLALIATETGGRAVFNQSDLAPELSRIGGEIQHYYSLAYRPPAGGTGGERRDHRIEVSVGDRSLTTRYRRGYLEKDPSQWLTERIEGALNLGLTSNRLEVRLGAGAIRESAPGTYRIPLHVMVPVERLAFLPQAGMRLAAITLRVMARPVDGSRMLVEDRTFQVQGAPGATGFADLAVELEMAAGTHVTAIGVRDDNTREASFISTTLQVGPEG